MDDKQFSIITKKLDLISRLLAVSAIRGLKSEDQVLYLSSAGLRPKEIAEILGKTPNAIRVSLFQIKKRQKTP
jgi:hypothetical protein